MLLPVLVLELLFKSCIEHLTRLFGGAISTQHSLGLMSSRKFAHFRDAHADNEEAARKSYGDGQSLAGLEERIEFTMLAGKKMLRYFEELAGVTPASDYRPNFLEAGNIVRNRLEFLIDGLEFQVPRLRRAKAHTQLNQTGVSTSPLSTGFSRVVTHHLRCEAHTIPTLPSDTQELTSFSARKPHRLRSEQDLSANSTRVESRQHGHESSSRTNYVLPARNLRRRLFRDATIRLVSISGFPRGHVKILGILGRDCARDAGCVGSVESLVGI